MWGKKAKWKKRYDFGISFFFNDIRVHILQRRIIHQDYLPSNTVT